jgi:uncharacterized protein
MEKRYINEAEFRAFEEGDKKYVEGYALRFDSESKDLGGFTEIISREAINDNTDMSDVLCLFNHSMNYVLARKNADVNTLEISVDENGLKYRFEVDEDISYQKDLYRNMQKGNISKSSFAFRISNGGDKWEKRDGKYLRTITSFSSISDVSVVTNPAYNDTVSLVRSFDEIKKELDGEEIILPKEISKVNENKLKYVGVISK